MVKKTFQSSEMMMRSLSVRCLFGNMKVEKLGKNAKNFGLPGSNTRTTTSPKPHLFEESVFSTGATADAAPSQQQPTTPLEPLFETAVRRTHRGGVCRSWNKTKMDVGH